MGAAGAGADPVYVDDVFSTFLYEGTGSSQSINNGIDNTLNSLIWIKCRNATEYHHLAGTHLGLNKYLNSNEANSLATSLNSFTSFDDDGFTLGTDGSTNQVNKASKTYVSWNFKAAPGFFDVVTWNGDGTNPRQIAHSLGSTPGMIIIKNTSSNYKWAVYHRGTSSSAPESNLLVLNETDASVSQSWFANTAPTSTHFSVEGNSVVNANGSSYVAYVFAHDDASFGTDGDESIIKCGSYSSTGFVNLGWEPQWIMIKSVSNTGAYTGDWRMFDNMRGIVDGDGDHQLFASDARAEDIGSFATAISLNATGFTVEGQGNYGTSTVYIAIRRPHKPPEAATDVFGISSLFTGDGDGSRAITTGGVTADLILSKGFGVGVAGMWTDRLRGGNSLAISGPQGDANSYWTLSDWYDLDVMDGYKIGGSSYSYSNSNGKSYISYAFKRASGFFDMVYYTGTGSATTINHNLGAVPSVVIVKANSATYTGWYWQQYDLGANTWMQLNASEGNAGNGSLFNSTLPTSSVFSVGSMTGNNGSGTKYIAYLFGDLPEISKSGTYSGTGNAVNVDCGFTNGARFILIKRKDGSGSNVGDWYVWDSVRGISNSNDPYFLLNSTATASTNVDYIDPLSSGFTVTSSAPAALNASGGTYLFFAVA